MTATFTREPIADSTVDDQEASATLADQLAEQSKGSAGLADSFEASIGTAEFTPGVIDSDAPEALVPALKFAAELFSATHQALPAHVRLDHFKSICPVVEWNPKLAAPIALVARFDAKGEITTGVFHSKKLGQRPALAVGPSWLTLNDPAKMFSAIVLAYADWLNLYTPASRERFNVDGNGFVRNRSNAKHVGWFAEVLGVDTLLGQAGRTETAIMGVKPMRGTWEPHHGAKYWAQQLADYFQSVGTVAEKVQGLSRFVPEKAEAPQAKLNRRAWVCHCRTSDSDKPKDLKRYAPAGQWLADWCMRCERFVRPLAANGEDVLWPYREAEGQKLLGRIAEQTVNPDNGKPYEDEAVHIENLKAMDKAASENRSPEARKRREGLAVRVDAILQRDASDETRALLEELLGLDPQAGV